MRLTPRRHAWRFVLSLALPATSVAASSTDTVPVEGIADRTPRSAAITNARLVVKPGQVIERGTLVVRDGRIVDVGAKVTVPSDALVVDVGGRSVFAGFIDASSDYAQPRDPEPVTPPARGADSDPPVSGARHWNRKVQPELDVAERLRPDAKAATALRELGFTSVLSVPGKGVLRGQSALVTTAEATRANEILVRPRVAQHIAFEFGTWPSRDYPASLMGAIALVRQTVLDARWQAQRLAWQSRHRDAEVIEANLALEALGPLAEGRQAAIFATRDELDIGRSLAIAREFDLSAVLVGSGREYRRVGELADARVPVIVPLDFPEAPAIEDPDRALDVSLAELEHWEWAPFNARVLASAGVPFAFTAAGLKKPQETFWKHVRKAVSSGLDEDHALAALTVQPAAMLGMSDRLGTLERGRLAQFVVADADLFRSDRARIHETWIDGRRLPSRGAPSDARGRWTLTWHGVEGPRDLDVSGETATPKGKAGDADVAMTVAGDTLTAYLPGRLVGRSSERVALVAALDGDTLSGRVVLDDGGEWRVEGRRADTARAAAAKAAMPPLPGSLGRYPAGEYGVVDAPAPRAVVFRHATVWTQETQGVLEDADVLVEGGRIKAIGRGLGVPSGTVEVDARGKHVTPGLIDAHSHMAVAGGVNESSHSVTSEVRVGDVLDPTDMTLYRQLAGGVTSAHLLHGSANTIGGQSQTIKLRWGGDAQALRFDSAPGTIKFALGENVKQANWGEAFTKRYPQTRMGVQEILVDSFAAAQDYRERVAAKKGAPVRRDLRLEALAEILDARRYVHVHSYRQDEILGFVRIAQRYRFVPTFQHVLEGYKVADELAALGAGASTFSDWWAYKMEVADAIPYAGALMTRQGVVVSFNSDSDELGRRLNTEAAKAVKYGGLAETDALDLVTRNPAKQLHVDSRVGSLAVGKDADLVVWNAHPLSSFAIAEQTWVDGRKRFDRADDLVERARILRERDRLVAKILPERVKALARGDGERKPDAAAPAPKADHDLVHFAGLRPPYHDSEPVNVCEEDHR
ncbi:amidohydrolase family protein [Dokdonella sp. MW10]|uniref:amidohydrolase family protein n=1 Tax=Dokdonella sp. MW10 TaxID=2992926 RepID=UPI003F8213CD